MIGSVAIVIVQRELCPSARGEVRLERLSAKCFAGSSNLLSGDNMDTYIAGAAISSREKIIMTAVVVGIFSAAVDYPRINPRMDVRLMDRSDGSCLRVNPWLT